ncbi:hypothetical protein BCR36DRAFT_333660 [Piromyces finnis]|uniref:Uncharacterized protein n=1 Tax=Piromyces finnis TaxID=1754191 RepID=A0A1Y1V275_9FUNG|nr:hypothetical protein BCR36DRAFT_333660 [Piromyces finnis]|eukprot:ORX44979.1 hypothetical protein BCR36DRAFT_333660 [Piromyces finnis]
MSVVSGASSSRKGKKRYSVPIFIAPDPRELMEAPANNDVNKVKRQMGMVYKIWTDTHKALCEATAQAVNVSSEIPTLKAVISFILMKKFFLEVGKKLPPMAIMDNWKVNDIVTFVNRANGTGRFLDKLEFDDTEQMGLILVSLRYSTEPYILAGAAWELANHDIELAVKLLCPSLYSLKNRDYDFLGQEVANLRIYWQGECTAEDDDDYKIAKLFEVGANCDDQCMKLWDILYQRIENSLNPCGVPQFVNLLGGFSLNGTWDYTELANFINTKLTLEWMDRRYGDAGRLVSLIWDRVYNLIVEEEDNTEEKKEEKIENMREFLDMITQIDDDYRANQIFLHMNLPEFATTDITANMIDEDPVRNQFYKYTSCREYPLFYTRHAFELTDHHMTKTLDIMAWWKEYRNPFSVSANQIWDCIFNDKETDEDCLYVNFGNFEDFDKVAHELIKNNSFRKGVDIEEEEKKFLMAFTDLASGKSPTQNHQVNSRYVSLPHSDKHYNKPHSVKSMNREYGDNRTISSDSTQDMIIRKSKSPAELKKSQKKHKATRRSSKMEKKTSKDNLRKQGRTFSTHNYKNDKLKTISDSPEADELTDSMEKVDINEEEDAVAADVLN